MGLVAVFAIGASVSNYINSAESVRGLHLEITSLRIIDDDNPRAIIRFRLHNRSPLAMEIERYNFNLTLNGQQVGTSISAYIGADPAVDSDVYRKARSINQTLEPQNHLDLAFPLYIHSSRMEIIRRAQRAGSMSWSVTASIYGTPPHARELDVVRLTVSYEE